MNFFGQNASSQQGGFLGAKPSTGSQSTGGGLFGGNTGSQSTGGGLFGNTTSTSASGTSGLFGSTNTTSGGNTSGSSTTGSQTTGSSPFGSSFFNLSKPSEQGGTQQPAAPTLFSQPTATSGTSLTPPTTGLFGAPKPTTSATASTSSSTTPAGGLLGSGGLFGKPLTTASTTTPQSTASPSLSTTITSAATVKDTSTAPASGGIFGNLGATAKPTEAKSTTPGTTGGFNLFGAGKADDKKDEFKGPQPFALGQTTTKETSGTSSASRTGAPSSIAVAPPSMLRGKTLEEIVNRWSSELETHVKEFNRFAGEVAVWDRALIENSKDIAALHSHVSAAEREQNDINQSLDHIEQQQKDLGNALDAYERIAQEILGGQGAGLRALDTGPADTERDKNYMLATDLHTQLDDLSSSLSQMIDSVNALTLPGDATSTDDPMSQIAQILSNHLESLQWIDGAVREVESKVGEVEKRVKDSGISMSSNITSKSRGFGVNR